MSTIEEVEGWWGVEWDWESGVVGIHPLREIVRRNGEAMQEGRREVRVVIGVCPTLNGAEEVRRLARRVRGERLLG
jgi:hypothetical protein